MLLCFKWYEGVHIFLPLNTNHIYIQWIASDQKLYTSSSSGSSFKKTMWKKKVLFDFFSFLNRELRACARASCRYDVGNGIRSFARSLDWSFPVNINSILGFWVHLIVFGEQKISFTAKRSEFTDVQKIFLLRREIGDKIDHYASYRVFFLCEATEDAGD